VARDFHALGFKVVWQPFLAEKLHAELEKARKIAEKLGVLFDGGKFMEQQRAADGHARGLMVAPWTSFAVGALPTGDVGVGKIDHGPQRRTNCGHRARGSVASWVWSLRRAWPRRANWWYSTLRPPG